MDKIGCGHNNLEKINNIYICKDCSLIRVIELNNNKKLLLSKCNDYNIKNEINIFQLTKNAINFYNNYQIKSDNKKLDNIFTKNSSLYLKYRIKLINHIYNLCSEIKSTYECFFLSVLLLDILIYKLKYQITNYQLDLFSTICFIISKKFVEKDKFKLEDYNSYLTICHSPQKFINSKDLIISEIEILKILNYDLNIPSSYTILKYMFICGIIIENENDLINYVNIYDECLDLLSFCNNNNEIGFNFNPVIIVFSIIYIIRKKYKLNNTDTLNLFSVFNIKFCQIKECVKLISNLYFDENDKKSTHIINNKKIIRKSFSQKKINGKKVEKRFLTPNKYINFNFSKNYYIMSIKIYKNEKNRIKEDKWFFRNSYRKRKITKINIKNSSIIGNNINYSINGNDFLISNQILR